MRQGSLLQVFTCFLSCTWTTPSLSWPETSLPGVDSKQQRVSWGELGSTGVVSGMGTQGNCEEKLGGGGQFQTSECTGHSASRSVRPVWLCPASGRITLPATCVGAQLVMHSYPRIPAPGMPSCFSRHCSGCYPAPLRMLFFWAKRSAVSVLQPQSYSPLCLLASV